MKFADLPHILGSSKKSLFGLYKVSETDITRDLDILRQWLKKMPHLPNNLLTDQMLENMLLRNKFSIEKTKDKLENYCTLRAQNLHLYKNYKDAVPSKEPLLLLPQLQLTEDFHRILFFKMMDEKNFHFETAVCTILLACELHLRFDYNDGFIILIDMNGTTPALMGRMGISLTSTLFQLVLKVYSARIKAIHLINAPSFIDLFLSFFKHALPTKVANRIHVYDSYEGFFKDLPRRYVPNDFGGTSESIKEITDHYDELFEDSHQFFEQILKIVSNEDLRQGKVKTEEIQGSFRQLRID